MFCYRCPVAEFQLNSVPQSVLVSKLVGDLVGQSVTQAGVVKLVQELVTYVISQLGNGNKTSLGQGVIQKGVGSVDQVVADSGIGLQVSGSVFRDSVGDSVQQGDWF